MTRKLQVILNMILIFIALVLYNYKAITVLNFNYDGLMKICYLLIITTNLIDLYSEMKNTYPKINIISILLKSFVVLIVTLLMIE
ncbi:hypothetical protein [Clostridium lundense]|uniref:hypothetical protein n=1 Tax=Clostridium lundense TaxID=319475 RepID=UPI000487AD9E|nr:hypothetical protein [Clostridium lundense]